MTNYIAFLTKKRYYLRMIVSFSVENYHSIREEVVLDLRIPGTAPDLPRFRRSEAKPDIRLPSVVVLIGPNGSGKTTLLSALNATARIASSALPTEENNPVASVHPVSFSGNEGKANTVFCGVTRLIGWRLAKPGNCSTMS